MKPLQWILTIITAGWLILSSPQTSAAQNPDNDEPRFKQLTETFKKEYLSIGFLLQTVGDFQPERSFVGNNGFNVANLRLKISGELDRGFGYFLQTNFVRSPAILDARMYLRVSPRFIIDVGQFKAPFSKEFLTSAGAIDFVNRAQVVTALSPARQIGVQATAWLKPEVTSLAVGVFNGNGFGRNNNDNNHFLYSARLSTFPSRNDEKSRLEIGVNVAVSADDGVSLTGLTNHFAGTRFLLGADFRWARDRLLLSSEVIYADLDADFGANRNPFGFYVTGGYMITGQSQLLLRGDFFETDGFQDDTHLIIFGYNLWPTQATELQVNFILPTDRDIENLQLLINAQFAF